MLDILSPLKIQEQLNNCKQVVIIEKDKIVTYTGRTIRYNVIQSIFTLNNKILYDAEVFVTTDIDNCDHFSYKEWQDYIGNPGIDNILTLDELRNIVSEAVININAYPDKYGISIY